MADDHEYEYEIHHEDSNESNDIILICGIGSVLLLAALVPAFNWYFNMMSDTELDEKVAGLDRDSSGAADYLEARNRTLAEQRTRIENGAITIDAAMAQLAGNRSVPVVAPQRNDGLDSSLDDALASLGAVEGWAQRKDEAGKAAAETALLRRRAVLVSQRLTRAIAEAVELKLDDEAARADTLSQSLRQNQTVETLGAAEEWLQNWPRTRAAAQNG